VDGWGLALVLTLGEAAAEDWPLGRLAGAMPKAVAAAHSAPGVAGSTPGDAGRALFAFGCALL
jgi:hypothetical protein